MAENLFSTFAISGQGMSVQRMRLSSVAKNIANINVTKGSDGQPYQREVVIARSIAGSPFENELDTQLSLFQTDSDHSKSAHVGTYPPDFKVVQASVARDTSLPRLVYDPSHPDSDEDGYVKMPNINVVTEMVEMISAQRAFEANTGVVESAKNMARDSLDI